MRLLGPGNGGKSGGLQEEAFMDSANNHGFLWKHWMGSGLLVFATCCLCLILWFLISCKAMVNFSSSNWHALCEEESWQLCLPLIEFMKEVIAINISTQPYFPHNLISVSKFVRGKEYVYKPNIVIGWKRVHQTIIQIVCSLLYPWKKFVGSPKILFNLF